MIYVMTGLHGDFAAYEKLKNEIGLKKADDLYLLGNIVCGKDGGIKILEDMLDAENIFPIAAKGEIDAARFLTAISNPDEKPSDSMRADMAKWFSKGGFALADTFMKIEDKEKKGYILEYLHDEFTLVEEIEVSGKAFVLSAKGLGGFDPDKDPYDYSAEELTNGDFDPTCDEYDDKYIVCGDLYDFTPDEGNEGKVVTIGKNIILNHAENENPVAIRLDDLKIFYV